MVDVWYVLYFLLRTASHLYPLRSITMSSPSSSPSWRSRSPLHRLSSSASQTPSRSGLGYTSILSLVSLLRSVFSLEACPSVSSCNNVSLLEQFQHPRSMRTYPISSRLPKKRSKRTTLTEQTRWPALKAARGRLLSVLQMTLRRNSMLL